MSINKVLKYTVYISSQCLKGLYLRLIELLDRSRSLFHWSLCGKITHQKQEELWMLQVMCKVVRASALISFFSERKCVLQVDKSYINIMYCLPGVECNRSINPTHVPKH